jgi:limonene-1,2-epoxide hydrolase
MNHTEDNMAIVDRYWAAHYARDWKRAAEFYAPDIHYTDVGADDVGANGPDETVARLGGLNRPEEYLEVRKNMVATGNVVVTEHVEILRFATGEEIAYPFVSVMEIQDGLIERWHDYGNVTLFGGGPPGWIEDAQNWRRSIAQSRD